MGDLDNPDAPGASLVVVETEVFNAVAPTTWTDLDLSAVVGSLPALVILKVICDDAVASAGLFAVRKNGDTDEYYYSTAYGAAAGQAIWGSGNACIVVVVTDAAGKVEIKFATAEDITIDVIGYLV